MTVYNLLIPESYEDQNGEEKTQWHRVGKAFPKKEGDGFDLVIPAGVSLSGRVVMLPRKEKEQAE